MNTVGESLMIARKRAGYSQGDLARMLGVSISFMSQVERDRKHLSYDRLALLPAEVRVAVIEAMMSRMDIERKQLAALVYA